MSSMPYIGAINDQSGSTNLPDELVVDGTRITRNCTKERLDESVSIRIDKVVSGKKMRDETLWMHAAFSERMDAGYEPGPSAKGKGKAKASAAAEPDPYS